MSKSIRLAYELRAKGDVPPEEGLKRKQRPDEGLEAATVATAAKKPREGLSFAEQLDRDKKELDARHAREYAAKDVEVQRELAGIHVQRLKEQERLFKLFMSDSVSAATYALNPQGYGLILSYAPLELQKKGIGLLENYSDANEMKSDSLVNRIITSHQAFNHLIDVAQQRISDDIDGNLEYFKNNQLWLSDLFKGTITPEITAYFLSENYENRLAVHSVLVNGNLMPFLTAYQENARSLLEELEERLQ